MNPCNEFKENPFGHRHRGQEKTYQCVYYAPDGESCASIVTQEELSYLLSIDSVANSFQPISTTYDKWCNDGHWRKAVITRAEEIIAQRESNNTD